MTGRLADPSNSDAVVAKSASPIFVVGTGRCGSTVFNDTLSYHPEVYWLSQLSERYPRRPAIGQAAMRFVSLPVLGPLLRQHIYPAEAYDFWEQNAPGFAVPCRDLEARDVTEVVRDRVRRALAGLAAGHRRRPLVKITGWPRIGFIKHIFPDARFIHVYRDGRAVANSWLSLSWFRGWSGPAKWLWGDLNARERQEWEEHDRSFVALAAIAWKKLMAAFDRAEAELQEGQLMRVAYEDVCARPLEVFGEALRFSGLDPSPAIEAQLRRVRFRSANDKWREQLTPAQQAVLEASLNDALARYGYT